MIPIHQANGKRIKCPECGKPGLVSPARNRVNPHSPKSEVIATAASWFMVECWVGKKLWPATTMVEVLPEVSHAG